MTRFLLVLLFVHAALGVSIRKRISDGDFFNVTEGGGSWLNSGNGTLGEPLNVVISGLSFADVLTDNGFRQFADALGFSNECFNIHRGAPQSANLGDGNGNVNQTMELRQKLPIIGTCGESVLGGNHLRMYRQNGANHNTSALFLAVSKEESASKHHTISSNGYDAGRDSLVDATKNLNQSFYSSVSVQSLPGYLAAGSNGINHGISVDGEIKLLTVQVGSDYINVGCARVISIPRTLSLITLVITMLHVSFSR